LLRLATSEARTGTHFVLRVGWAILGEGRHLRWPPSRGTQ